MAEKLENAVPVVPNMWHEKEDGIHLIGSKCEDCGEIYFPKKEVAVCSHCQGENILEISLSRVGRIVSYTKVHQPPAGGFYKSSVPFIYIIAELPEGVHIQGHFIGLEFERIETGLPVQVVLDLLYEDQNPRANYRYTLLTPIPKASTISR
jgi:uncharacterized OB-fold protein